MTDDESKKSPGSLTRKSLTKSMLIGLIGGCTMVYGGSLARRITDPLLEVPKEVALEREIGIPIYFGILEMGGERTFSARMFEMVYRGTKNRWDNLDRQFSLIKGIRVLGTDHFYGGRAHFSSRKLEIFPNEEYLVHELAHFWHHNLEEKGGFEEKWEEISGDNYMGNYKGAKIEDITRNGSVSLYSLRGVDEDIAETARFVYRATNPNIVLRDFPNNDPNFRQKEGGWEVWSSTNVVESAIPKVLRKVELLNEYGFISDREYAHTVNELNGFSREQN